MGELGLTGLLVPEEYGGSDMGAVLEEIGRVDQSVAATLENHLSGGSELFLAGTHEQKLKWLVPLARGEVIGALALTEPGAGSDAVSLSQRLVASGVKVRTGESMLGVLRGSTRGTFAFA